MGGLSDGREGGPKGLQDRTMAGRPAGRIRARRVALCEVWAHGAYRVRPSPAHRPGRGLVRYGQSTDPLQGVSYRQERGGKPVAGSLPGPRPTNEARLW